MLLEKKGVSLMLSNARKGKRTKSLIMLWGIYNPLSIQLEHYPIVKKTKTSRCLVSRSVATEKEKTLNAEHQSLVVALIPAGRHICPAAIPALTAAFAHSA
jgi:hypothetical protein